MTLLSSPLPAFLSCPELDAIANFCFRRLLQPQSKLITMHSSSLLTAHSGSIRPGLSSRSSRFGRAQPSASGSRAGSSPLALPSVAPPVYLPSSVPLAVALDDTYDNSKGADASGICKLRQPHRQPVVPPLPSLFPVLPSRIVEILKKPVISETSRGSLHLDAVFTIL
jgi:hypothetical protein